jgi:predicted DsbA family dithiol-disulfide isomerase
MGLADYIYRVYGIRLTVDDPNSALNQAGRRVRITFNNARRMVNTDDSHRLVELAKELGKQDEMVEKIFQEYFENAVNISDRNALIRIGSEVLGDQMSADQLREFFASDKHADTVAKQLKEIRGVSGVPHFTIHVPNSARK